MAPRFISKTFHSVIETETAINHFVAKLDAYDEVHLRTFWKRKKRL